MISRLLQRAAGRWKWIFASCCLLTGIVWFVWLLRPAPPEILPIDVRGMERPVAESVQSALDQVRKKPRSAQARGELGMILLAHKLFEPARSYLRQAEQLDSSDPRWPYLEGVCLERHDNLLAIESFAKAAKLAGDDPLPRAFSDNS